MILNLYSVTEADNVANKTLVNPKQINIRLKRDVDIISPILILQSNDLLDLRDYNYAVIPDLKRNYFIKDCENISNTLWQLSLECDVLTTYLNDVVNADSLFRRKIKSGDYFDVDLDRKVIPDVTIIKTDVGFSDDVRTYVLTTVGAESVIGG